MSYVRYECKNILSSVILSISCLHILPVFLKPYSNLLSILPTLPFIVLAEPLAPRFHSLAILLLYLFYLYIHPGPLPYLLSFLLFAFLPTMFCAFTRILVVFRLDRNCLLKVAWLCWIFSALQPKAHCTLAPRWFPSFISGGATHHTGARDLC